MTKSTKGTSKKLVERREFLGGAATMAGASLIGRGGASPWADMPLAAPPEPPPAPAPGMTAAAERKMRRWEEQRWLVDAVVQTVGIEWDQARVAYTLGPCGPDATADFAGIRSRIHKFNDMSREYARAAVRREKMARQFESEKHNIAARESYFIAALLYGSAQWPVYENTRENLALNERKVACYSKYIQYADHEIRKVEVPFAGKSLPGYLHLPANRPSGKIPAVWVLSGMDSFKELSVALYGDKLLERGMAVLALEGPGQGECCVRDVHVTATNWMQAGPAVLSALRSQNEVDSDRIALSGTSMGSYWGTQVASVDDRLKACVVRSVCHEPGMNTIFNMASPTFKLRFMYMSGIQDEGEFDKFAQGFSLKGTGEKVKCPYLVLAGEDDHLSPIEFTYNLLETIPSPKQLLLYEGADHGLGNASSAALGPNPVTFVADWIRDRMDGRPVQTMHMKVDATGQVHESSFEDARKALSVPILT
jgi:fermentation-respiration switch protein FrsA (DUF1100 family)